MGLSRLKSPVRIFVATSFCVTAFFSRPSKAETPNPQQKHMPSQQTILDCVKRYTGFDESDGVEKIEPVPLSTLNVPFLSSKLNAETGIHVRFASGKIKWRPPLNEIDDPYERHISVFLDAEAKRLLAVTIRLGIRPPDIQVLPLGEQEQRLRASGTIYESFPANVPKVSFLQALAAVHAKGLGKPLRAKEIDGFYLNLAFPRSKSETTARWIIILRGLPAFGMPSWHSTATFTRNGVDPTTGEWIGANANSGAGF